MENYKVQIDKDNWSSVDSKIMYNYWIFILENIMDSIGLKFITILINQFENNQAGIPACSKSDENSEL